jgi:hypothetical protein
VNVYCYHHDPADGSFPTELVDCWRQSFTEHKFNPTVLSEADARRHPQFDQIKALVETFPTANDRVYENACWLRWLAFELVAPALFTDYDVINFALAPDMVPTKEMATSLQIGRPSCLYASPKAIREFVSLFKNAQDYVTDYCGKLHVSDMIVFWHWLPIPTTPLCVNYSQGNAPLIHFCNALCPAEERDRKRHITIARYRSTRFLQMYYKDKMYDME